LINIKTDFNYNINDDVDSMELDKGVPVKVKSVGGYGDINNDDWMDDKRNYLIG